MIDGKNVPITTCSDELVSDVKAKMYEKVGIPTTDQRLMRLEGRDLEDRKQLRDYGMVSS